MNKKEHERFAQPEDCFGMACVLWECLVADFSPSMDSKAFEPASTKRSVMYEAQKAYLDVKLAKRPDDFVALVGFHDKGILLSPFLNVEECYTQLAVALEQSRSVNGNGTRLDLGLEIARDLVRRRDTRLRYADVPVITRVLAYSDGYTGGEKDAIRFANELKSSGVIIHTYGVGKNPRDVDEQLMRKVASTIEGVTHYKFLGDGAEIRKTFEQLAHGMLTI